MIHQTIRDSGGDIEIDAFINTLDNIVLTINHLPSQDDGLSVFVFEELADLDCLIMRLTALRGHFTEGNDTGAADRHQ